MRDLEKKRERYLRLPGPMRLGNLASSLQRLSQWVRSDRDDRTAVELMREAAWMIEWSGDLATADLAEMQRELCRWRRIWPCEAARSILALRARRMSEDVLDMAGLGTRESTDSPSR